MFELKPIYCNNYYGNLDDMDDVEPVDSFSAIFCCSTLTTNVLYFPTPPRESTGPAVTTSMKQRIANPTIPTVVIEDKNGTLATQQDLGVFG